MRSTCLASLFFVLTTTPVGADDDPSEVLKNLPSEVVAEADRDSARHMVRDDQRRRIRAANARNTAAWRAIDSVATWESFAKPRIGALARSLGESPAQAPLEVRTTGKISGQGFRIENILFQSRPRVWVAANLYLPAESVESAPGILICHSHHAPKTSGELQDMGMTWARLGCVVLVMDQLGYGERLQHPFRSEDDYAGEYKRWRQPYYFRYDTGIQLHLVGQSLIGWMVHDLSRGVDLLLERSEVDPQRIALLGSVAGGGDPAAVCAAVDRRIQVVVPYNFGGPQPETVYPLPKDPEAHFNYAGSGGWESTRNLRRSAADGFLPWVIVGSIAPRSLIYAHEFAWDRPHDPVWKRLKAIYAMYDADKGLAFAHGRANVRLRPPEATHCTHIGKEHRKMIHPPFSRWLRTPMSSDDEYSARRESEELHCWTEAARADLPRENLTDWLPALADRRLAAARADREKLGPAVGRKQLVDQTLELLGRPRVPAQAPPTSDVVREHILLAGQQSACERGKLQVEPEVFVPYLLLTPKAKEPVPAVFLVAQQGKAECLAQRSGEITTLLANGVAVCLVDVRGTGETRESRERGPWGSDTARSSTDLMLGRTTLGMRLYDCQRALAFVRQQPAIDAARIAIWGESLGPVNAADTNFRIPRRAGSRPAQSEPLGATLALLLGLCEPEIHAVYTAGGLTAFRDVLVHQFVQIPHDMVVPGQLEIADVADWAAAIAPRPLYLARLVDGLNRTAADANVRRAVEPIRTSYAASNSSKTFAHGAAAPAEWLIEQLNR